MCGWQNRDPQNAWSTMVCGAGSHEDSRQPQVRSGKVGVGREGWGVGGCLICTLGILVYGGDE